MSTVTPESTRPHGRRLSTRLTIGFVGLLAILLAVGIESLTLLSDLGGSIDVIQTANAITDLNHQNMVQANDRVRKLAEDASRRMATMLLLGTAFAGLCIFFLWWSLLRPLERFEAATAANQIAPAVE